MEFPTGCLSREYWRLMFNLTEEELNGRAFTRLGYGGTVWLETCQCQEQPRPFNPFQPFKIF